MAPNGSMNAVIIGPYRVHNFGDDLVGAILVKHLQSAGYKVTVPRLGQANADWLGIDFHENYGKLIKQANLIVVGGGGIMSDTSGSKPGASYLDIVARAAMNGDLTNKRVFITSVGAGPWILERSKMLAFGVSIIAEKIGVRDQDSFNHLASIGIKGEKVVLGADCALLSSDYLDFKPQASGKIGLQFDVRQFSDIHENPNITLITKAIQSYIRKKHNNVVLVSNGDAPSAFHKVNSSCEILKYNDLQTYLPRLSSLRSIFTSHLHLAITSYSQRIPTFSLFVREKTKRFYEQIGRPERAIDLKVATLHDFERFIAAAETATWTDRDEETLQKLQSQARSLLSFLK